MITGNFISQLFGSSPVKPLQQHMYKVYECTKQLIPFFEAVAKEDYEEVERLQKLIGDLEHDADVLKKELQLHLPKTLFIYYAQQTRFLSDSRSQGHDYRQFYFPTIRKFPGKTFATAHV